MPTIFIFLGFRFFFYSNDHAPIHVHVTKAEKAAKFGIAPVRMIENHGFSPSDLRMLESIIQENEEVICEHWNRFFNNTK